MTPAASLPESSWLRVAVSQRVHNLADRGERRDVLDQAWTPLLAHVGAVCLPVPNRFEALEAFLTAVRPHAVLLTGGGNISEALTTRTGDPVSLPGGLTDLAPERDRTERALLAAAEAHNWPVLGVCRGMQTLLLYHGGALTPTDGHTATRHPITPTDVTHDSTPSGVHKAREVNSFHDLAVTPDGLPAALTPLATAPDGTIEAFTHRTLRQVGIMWHPERQQPPDPADLALLGDALGGHRSA